MDQIRLTRETLVTVLIWSGGFIMVETHLIGGESNTIHLNINPSVVREFDNEWCSESSWETWSRATGNWNGGRIWLSDSGVTLQPIITSEASRVMSGEIPGESRNTVRHLADLFVTWNLATTFGWSGATVAAHGQWSDGDNASAATGDLQEWSNISTDRDLRQVSEFWFEQGMWQRPGSKDQPLIRVKMGKVDANTEYDNLPIADQFINSSARSSPTIYGFPSFPDPAMGIHLGLNPTSWLSATAGYLDGSGLEIRSTGKSGVSPLFEYGFDDHKFYIGQVRGEWPAGTVLGLGAGLVQIGAWHHSGPMARLDGGIANGTTGYFAQGQVELWQGQEGRSVSIFVQWGSADDAINPIARHQAAGLYWTGIPWKRTDGAGLYWSNITLSTDSSLGFDTHHETALEVVYDCRVFGWWLLKGDVQYIIDPGGSSQGGNAWIVALRSELSL
jgi:porin